MTTFPSLIVDLATILAVAAVVTLVFRWIRQPVVLGYIVAGVIVGPFTPPIFSVTDVHGVEIWAQLGVIFLMFSLGLHFNFRQLSAVAGRSGVSGIFEISMMLAIGYLCGRLFGWTKGEAIFLGCMIAISSTTIIVKCFEELGLSGRRFSENVLGILIVEDLAAILMLGALTAFATGGDLGTFDLVLRAGKLALVVATWLLVGMLIVPRYIKTVRRHGNEEMLVVVSLGLCLFLVSLAVRNQYSAALGAFVMGSILSETSASARIEELVRPVRDLFAAVFFVSVGMLVNPAGLVDNIPVIATLAVVLIVGKTLAVGIGCLVSGQKLSDSIQSGLSMGQVGEFSFIIATLAQAASTGGKNLYPIIVAVSVVTTFTTPYAMKASGRISPWLEGILPERFLAGLLRYGYWLQRQRMKGDGNRSRAFGALRWSANAVGVLIFFRLALVFVKPFLERRLESSLVAGVLSWTVAMGFSAPLLWAMLKASPLRPIRWSTARFSVAGDMTKAVVGAGLAVLLVLVLSVDFFPRLLAAMISLLVGALVVTVFFKRLGTFYTWFEARYLEEMRSAGVETPGIQLAPWDAGLVRLSVHPNSELAGRSIAELALRDRFGVNIVAIERGEALKTLPSAHELVMPCDVLLLLGNDAGVEGVKPLAGKSDKKLEICAASADYVLSPLLLDGDSPLAGNSLATSRIKEVYRTLVVGVERKGERLLTPAADFVMMPDDTVWVVGQLSDIKAMETR